MIELMSFVMGVVVGGSVAIIVCVFAFVNKDAK